MTVDVRVLGGVEADVDGRPLDLGHARQQCVLVALLVDANQVVSIEQLTRRVWGERPPTDNTLQSYVSRLRRIFAHADGVGLDRRGNGYVLHVGRESVDLHRFGQLVAEARASRDDETAQELFERALSLWRGEAFASLDTAWLNAVRETLHQQRFAAEMDCTDVRLRRGQHAALLAELSDRARSHPLDERVAEQFMLALYRCGRAADALARYQATRRRLAEELGSDPGPELQRLHRKILTADPTLRAPTITANGAGPAPTPVPRQLPAPPLTFTGRDRELGELSRVLRPADRRARGLHVGVIHGTAGVGKTWLAVRWANDHRQAFPDGQLYVNLRGFGPAAPALDPSEALRGFLYALGVAADRLPAGVEALTGLYRSMLADKRVLVLLDNVRDDEQVRPLLPGSAGCLVLVTSRNRLTGLIAEGADQLHLGLPSAAEARQMLIARLGPQRMGADRIARSDAVDDIIACCARLPIALAVVAARAATVPALPLRAIADELRDEVTVLSSMHGADPATDVWAIFSWSYRALGPDAARLFRWLGLHPGPDIALPAAASLLGLRAAPVRTLLAELTRMHLVNEDHAGRYRFHDLLRAYAKEQAQIHDGEADRSAALHRLLDHYLHTAHRAARLLGPPRGSITLPPPGPGVAVESLRDRDHAAEWFTAERAVLNAIVTQAPGGCHDHVWQLATTINIYLDRQGYVHENVAVQAAGLRAAQILDDRRALAYAHRDLGYSMIMLDDMQDAAKHNERAIQLFDEVGEVAGAALAHRNLAWIAGRNRDFDAAVAHAQRSLRAYRSAGHRAGEAGALNNVGWYRARRGEHGRALRYCQRALRMFVEVGDRRGEGCVWDSLGYIYFYLGETAQGAACYERAVEIFRELEDWYQVAETLTSLGNQYDRIDRPDAAHRAWCGSLTELDRLDFPVRAAVSS